MNITNFRLEEFLHTYPSTKDWPGVDTGKMSPETSKVFVLRRSAVDMVFDGISLRQITAKTGIRRESIYSMLIRCVSVNPLTGRIYGYGGCIPKLRIGPYTRTAADKPGAGKAGLLGKLFLEYPEIKERLDAYHLKKVDYLLRKGIKPSAELLIPGTLSKVDKSFDQFVRLCKQSHIPTGAYPYTSTNWGYEAIRRYLIKLVKTHLREALQPVYGVEAARRMARTSGDAHSRPTHPYVQVSIDEQTADLIIALVVPDLLVGEKIVRGARIQVVVVVEMMTTAVLSYAISYNQHATSTETIMLALYRALKPWSPRKFTIPGLDYQKGDGFPSGCIQSLQWATWSETLLDNSLAHKSEEVQRVTQDVIGSEVHMGVVGAPEVREGIERVFRALAGAVWPELPGATGSGPSDPRRNDALKEALGTPKTLSIAILDEFLEAWFARYNNTQTERLGFKTPLEFLADAEKLGRLEVTHFDSDNLVRLYKFGKRVVKAVGGNPAEGRPIYVEYLHARYSSHNLSYAANLLGKKIVLYIHPEDARYAMAFSADGTELDIVTVKGKWSAYRHTLEMRRLYSKLKPKRHAEEAKHEDPIHFLAEYLMGEARKSNAKAMRYQEFLDVTGYDESTHRENSSAKNISDVRGSSQGTDISSPYQDNAQLDSGDSAFVLPNKGKPRLI